MGRILVEPGFFTEAWCETCDWRMHGDDKRAIEKAAFHHEHDTLGQDVGLWKWVTDPTTSDITDSPVQP